MTGEALDSLWLLLCAGLVFLMQPGFMCLESGLTRSKSAINVALKNLADFGLSIGLFWAFGYGWMFGDTLGGWFGHGRLAPAIEGFDAWPAAFFVFYAMFCGTAVTIVSGAVAERLRFQGYLVITLLFSGPIYTVFGHWAWNGLDAGAYHGWLGALGFRDFAGSTVVHGAGGWLALAAVTVLGPRHDRFPSDGSRREIPGHNLPMALLGGFLLWLGWLGFNGGSALGWRDNVPAIVANTMLAGAAGLIAALGASRLWRGYADAKLAMNGALAGLVSITGACQAVGSAAAVGIGAGGGLVMAAASRLLERRRIDDVVGAVPVHAAAGVWGTLAVGLFADLELLGTGLERGQQLAVQALGAGVCFLWAFGGGYLALRLVDRVVGLRVSPEEEARGLNVVEHGATTELLELVSAMDRQAESGDLSLRVEFESGTEVGEIATQYNRVIAALQRAMEDVRDGADRYRRTIDNALDAIVTVDRFGSILGWNPRAAAIFGWSRDEALGKDVFELVTRRREGETTRTGLLSFLTTGGESPLLGQRIEITAVDRDGREFPVEATFTMAATGDEPEFNLFFQDITERRRARRALQRAKETAEAATRARSEFLANMSHEIRTPMNGILGIVELMLDAAPGRRQQRYLEMIKTSADSLLRLLDDVLDYSKIEAGKFDVQALEFPLRRRLVDLLGALAVQARVKGLTLACRVAPEVPEPLIGDPIRLGQVILNLVANAIKFTAEGEVVVEVRERSRGPADAVLEFTVSDTGPGIPPDKHELIFNAFEQADALAAGGTGLGLAICKRLVEIMGGDIAVEGEPGAGSTFRFTSRFGLPDAAPDAAPSDGENGGAPEELPLLDVDADDADDEASIRREPRIGPCHALVVEDNRINQVVAQGLLEAWGVDVDVVSSGAEALGALERRSFDLVLMDMRMPDMDGFAATAAIRAGEAGSSGHVPIIAMTANVAPGDRRKCLDAGMDGYVTKPIDRPALLAAVRSALATAAEDPPAEDPAAGDPAASRAFDRAVLLRRAGGRRRRAETLARLFLEEDGPRHRAALDRAVANGDAAAIRDGAHALRGAAGEICAPALATVAERLEAAAAVQDPQQIEAEYETLTLESQKLFEDLEAFLEDTARPPGGTDDRHSRQG